MRGKVAKRLRKQGTPKGPGPNFTDREDTRPDRREKRFKKRRYAATLRDTDPQALRKRLAFWSHVRAYLMMPEYREGLGSPTKEKNK